MVDQQVLDGLIDASFTAKRNAYCPYSKFPVGAALLCEDGTVITGCNVENVSYSMTVCAERTAIGAAISRGYRKFSAIVISSDLKDSFISPCGNCRQTLIEFGSHLPVYMTKPDRTYIVSTIGDLLPHAFEPESLRQPRVLRESNYQQQDQDQPHQEQMRSSSGHSVNAVTATTTATLSKRSNGHNDDGITSKKNRNGNREID